MSKKFKALMLALALIATPVMSIPVANTTSVEAQAATKKKVTYTDTQKKIAKALKKAKYKTNNPNTFKVVMINRVHYKLIEDSDSVAYNYFKERSKNSERNYLKEYRYLNYEVFYTWKDKRTGLKCVDSLHINGSWGLLYSNYWDDDYMFCYSYYVGDDETYISDSSVNKINTLLSKY